MGARFLLQKQTRLWALQIQRRGFCSCSVLASGHNRWSKIKHDKGKEDALKSKARSILSQELYLASKYGGPDPALNTRLATAIANAKKGALAKSSIESAIAKGQGKALSGAPLETLTIEAMLPHGVATLIECQTEQKLRVLQDVRSIINRSGGTITPTSFFFDKKGKVWFSPQEEIAVDDILDEAIDAGALEVDLEDGQIVVETEPNETTSVAQKIGEKFALKMDRSEIYFDPKEESMVSLSDEQESEIANLIGMIEEEPSLQNLYVNAASRA